MTGGDGDFDITTMYEEGRTTQLTEQVLKTLVNINEDAISRFPESQHEILNEIRGRSATEAQQLLYDGGFITDEPTNVERVTAHINKQVSRGQGYSEVAADLAQNYVGTIEEVIHAQNTAIHAQERYNQEFTKLQREFRERKQELENNYQSENARREAEKVDFLDSREAEYRRALADEQRVMREKELAYKQQISSLNDNIAESNQQIAVLSDRDEINVRATQRLAEAVRKLGDFGAFALTRYSTDLELNAKFTAIARDIESIGAPLPHYRVESQTPSESDEAAGSEESSEESTTSSEPFPSYQQIVGEEEAKDNAESAQNDTKDENNSEQ